MGRRVLRGHIWGYSVCLSHKTDAGLNWVKQNRTYGLFDVVVVDVVVVQKLYFFQREH